MRRAAGVPWAEVIGDPVAHSKSPLIHRFWLETLGLAGWFGATRVTADALAGWIAARRADPDWRGCSVTMPLKAAILAHVDEADARAARLGAANLVVRCPDGTLVAANTDVDGVAGPLRRRLGAAGVAGVPDPLVRIVGAGGAARAALMGAKAAGLRAFEVYNRKEAAAHALAAMAGDAEGRGFALSALARAGPAGGRPIVLVNATSMGMEGFDPVPVDLGGWSKESIVFDMVYVPLDTGLLRAARARGMATIDGLEMLVAQARPAFAQLFGQPPPAECDDALRARLVKA